MKRNIVLLFLLLNIKISIVHAENCSGNAQIPQNVLGEFDKISSTYKKSEEKVSEIRTYIEKRNGKELCDSLVPILSGIRWLTKKKFEEFDKSKVKNPDVQAFLKLLDAEIKSRSKERPGGTLVSLKENIRKLEAENKNLGLWLFIWKTLALVFLSFVGLLYLFAQFSTAQLDNLLLIRRPSYQQNSNEDVQEPEIQLSQNKNAQVEDQVETLQQQTDSNEQQNLITQLSLIHEEKVRLENTVKAQQQNILELEDKISKQKSFDSEKYNSDDDESSVEKTLTESNVRLVESRFYLSLPGNINGMTVFYDRREPKYDALKTCYEFLLEDTSAEKAQFSFADNNAYGVSNAIQFFDTYIDPACEYDEINRNATRIITVQNGEAIKNGDVWEVIHKAKIEFR